MSDDDDNGNNDDFDDDDDVDGDVDVVDDELITLWVALIHQLICAGGFASAENLHFQNYDDTEIMRRIMLILLLLMMMTLMILHYITLHYILITSS